MSTNGNTPKKLTGPQEKFAGLVAGGMNQSEAYRECYPKSRKWQPQSVHPKASALADKVAIRIDEIASGNKKLAKLTLADKFNALYSAVTSPVVAWSDKMKAIDIDNKMQRHYEPEVNQFLIQVNIGGNADDE